MVLHCHHHFYFPRHSQRESFVDNILPNCIIDIWAGVSCTKNCSNKLKSRIHNLPSQKAAQFLLSSDPPAPWAYLFNWVTRSTTNKITPMAIALPTTTGMMYLEYHLHQQNRWVKGRQSLRNLSFIAIAYLISSQRQAQEYLSVFLLVGTGLWSEGLSKEALSDWSSILTASGSVRDTALIVKSCSNTV